MKQKSTLKENDYLTILELIEKLYVCNSRSDLKSFFVSELLPRFDFDSALYGWTDSEIQKPQLVDVINFPPSMLPTLQSWIPGDPVSKKGLTHNRAVVACDIDLDRKELAKHTKDFINRESISDQEAFQIKNVHSSLVMLDLPDLSLGIGFHRSNSNVQPISQKEVRMLELLRPHLLQSIKTIILSEENFSFKALIQDELGKSETAMALLGVGSRILYKNEKFDQLFALQPGEFLPNDLMDLIQSEVSKQSPPYNIENPQVALPFYNLPQGNFRLNVTVLNGKAIEEEHSILIRLKPVVEPYVKLNKFLQESNLTNREIEICALVKEGIGNEEIASRLFISQHTVKNHVNNIYRKLDVHNRAELVSLLSHRL